MERVIKILSQSFKAVRSFKLRTFFCLISISLGIASIVIIVASVEGAYKRALELVSRFGHDSLLIFGGSEEARALQRQRTITLDDVEAVRTTFSTAYLVVPMTSVNNVSVSFRDRKYQTQVIGSTDDYSKVWTWPVIQGSDLNETDIKGLRNVGLIGQHLLKELFGDEEPIGKYIIVKGLPVQIIGILSERGTAASGQNLDDRIVMPITTVMRKLQNETRYISAFRIRFVDRENLELHRRELRDFLRMRHSIPPDEPDDFRIVSSKEIIRFLVALTGSLVAFLGIVGVISLIIAGFVIANLFLLSVRERVPEIGIRRAVGARRQDIFLQFLGESIMITSVGGLIGFLLALGASRFLKLIADFPIYFSWKAFVVGLILSWVVGIGFGLQPARYAASLSPIEAIRK